MFTRQRFNWVIDLLINVHVCPIIIDNLIHAQRPN